MICFGLSELNSVYIYLLIHMIKMLPKNRQNAGFSTKSKVAFPKTEVLEKPQILIKIFNETNQGGFS